MPHSKCKKRAMGECHRQCMPMLLVKRARKKTKYNKEAEQNNNVFTN